MELDAAVADASQVTATLAEASAKAAAARSAVSDAQQEEHEQAVAAALEGKTRRPGTTVAKAEAAADAANANVAALHDAVGARLDELQDLIAGRADDWLAEMGPAEDEAMIAYRGSVAALLTARARVVETRALRGWLTGIVRYRRQALLADREMRERVEAIRAGDERPERRYAPPSIPAGVYKLAEGDVGGQPWAQVAAALRRDAGLDGEAPQTLAEHIIASGRTPAPGVALVAGDGSPLEVPA